jgi:hypothetical protein
MKTVIASTAVIGLAVLLDAPVSAAELDGSDPVVASFRRDLNRDPTPTGQLTRADAEQDRLPEVIRAALEASTPSRPDQSALTRRN